MQILRQYRGVSRTVLTVLIGMSASWVRRVENGQLQAPSLEMVLRAAESLRIQNLDELTSHKMRINLFNGPGHPQLPTVADTVNRFPITHQNKPRRAFTSRLTHHGTGQLGTPRRITGTSSTHYRRT
ncbi:MULTISPECIES: helix-turn-helix domain-containing protein [Streptomyces]|uniref:helix-turn-helix domain-containing protein n=1 Tax=Streptomyces TaxID=1883 RepID=UPI00069C588B|nr:helix-turn-helix transcriptional regulator [Streptomyces sp. SID7805]MYU50803.1 helix-turn-helix domain-containing protein [Streptomyces sp. SID7805]